MMDDEGEAIGTCEECDQDIYECEYYYTKDDLMWCDDCAWTVKDYGEDSDDD